MVRYSDALPSKSNDRGRSLPLVSTRFGPKFITMPVNCALTTIAKDGGKQSTSNDDQMKKKRKEKKTETLSPRSVKTVVRNIRKIQFTNLLSS